MLIAAVTCLITIISIVLVSLTSYLLWVGTHWKRKGIPSYGNAVTGIFLDTFLAKRAISVCLRDMYLKNTDKFYGTFIFGQPTLVIQDREIIKHVMLKEYSNFSSHGIHYDATKDPLSANIFNLAGEDWKFMRAKLSPNFSSGKVKFMFNTVQECVSTVTKAVDMERLSNNNLVEIRDLLGRLGTDIILSVAFGIEANSVENADSAFRKIGRNHLDKGLKESLYFLMKMNRKLYTLNAWLTPVPEVNKFLLESFTRTVAYREQNNVRRNDFIDLMIKLKNQNNFGEGDFNGRKITVQDIAAQSYFFFLAGFETVSSTSSSALLELAKHPDIQKKVQEECDNTMEACGGNVTYEAIQSMEYTDKVLQETMRLYPAVPCLPRAAIKSCPLPLTDVTLEKDTLIWIPVFGLHMDGTLFPNPTKFDPERFSKENIHQIPNFAYMPFGDGPRQCIAMKLGQVQMKCVLLELLTRYSFELSDQINPNPEFNANNIVLRPVGSFKLKVTLRNKTESELIN